MQPSFFPFFRQARPARRVRLGVSIFVSALLLFLSFGIAKSARAEPFDPAGRDWEGLSELVLTAQSELGMHRVVVASTLQLGQLRPEDGLAIIHPEHTLDVDELAAFMRAGGRIILLDDYGTGDELLLHFGIRRVPLPARPAGMLRGNPSFAIAEPASMHPTVRDVSHVVTNHGTGLEHKALSPLLVVRGEGETDALLAVAGAVGRGRFIAIGDASIPMNAMMRYPGNRALSRALVRYATDDDVWGKRGGTLYVLANGFRTTGRFGDATSTDTALGEVRRMMLGGLETLRRDGMPPVAAYLAAIILGLGIVVWTSTHVGRLHKPASPRFVRPVPVAFQGGIAGHAAVLRSPQTSRALAVMELKSALEEQLAMRLGLERAATHDELVASVRAANVLDADHTLALARLLEDLGRAERAARRLDRSRAPIERIRDAGVIAMGTRVRDLLAAVSQRGRA